MSAGHRLSAYRQGLSSLAQLDSQCGGPYMDISASNIAVLSWAHCA